jgi:hypothetical protein
MRDPIARVVSFYYERVAPFTHKALNDLTAEELDFLLPEFFGSAFSRFRDEVR